MEHTRPASRRLTPRPGDPLVTNRRRPILTLAADSSPGVHDTLIAACDIHRYRQLGYAGLHDNCTDNLRMAMLAIGRRAAEIPCPFNIWMNTPPLPDGSIAYLAPVSAPGDHVDLWPSWTASPSSPPAPWTSCRSTGADNTPKALHAMVAGRRAEPASHPLHHPGHEVVVGLQRVERALRPELAGVEAEAGDREALGAEQVAAEQVGGQALLRRRRRGSGPGSRGA